MANVAGPSRTGGSRESYAVVPVLSGHVRHHHIRRTVAYLLGVALLVMAYLALLPTVTIVAVVLVFSVSEGEAPRPGFDLEPALFIAGSILVAVLLWRLGVVLIRGRRHLALFLRKFGFTQATETLSLAIGSGLGRRWRLVTLDDDDVAPMGVSGRSRWTVRLARLLLVGLAIAATVAAIRAAMSDVADEASREAYDQAYAEAIARGDSEFEAIFGAGFSGAIAGVMVAVLLVVFWSILISLLATGGLLLSVVGHSARTAERAKAVVVVREAQVRRALPHAAPGVPAGAGTACHGSARFGPALAAPRAPRSPARATWCSWTCPIRPRTCSGRSGRSSRSACDGSRSAVWTAWPCWRAIRPRPPSSSGSCWKAVRSSATGST